MFRKLRIKLRWIFRRKRIKELYKRQIELDLDFDIDLTMIFGEGFEPPEEWVIEYIEKLRGES